MRKGIRLQIVFVSSNSNQGSTGSGGDRPYDTGRAEDKIVRQGMEQEEGKARIHDRRI